MRSLLADMYSQSHLGWHFRKLKAQSSNVSFATFQWKETFELWALRFETAFENVTPSGIGCIWLWETGRMRVWKRYQTGCRLKDIWECERHSRMTGRLRETRLRETRLREAPPCLTMRDKTVRGRSVWDCERQVVWDCERRDSLDVDWEGWDSRDCDWERQDDKTNVLASAIIWCHLMPWERAPSRKNNILSRDIIWLLL